MRTGDEGLNIQGEAEDGRNTAEGSNGTNGQVDDTAVEVGRISALFSRVMMRVKHLRLRTRYQRAPLCWLSKFE